MDRRERLPVAWPLPILILLVGAATFGCQLDEDGILDPASTHQRYRRPEYRQDRPFFQWWYFNVKDLANNRYFAFTYSLLDCVKDPKREGLGVDFSMIEKGKGTLFHKRERFPLGLLAVKNDFDLAIDVHKNDNKVDYRLDVLDDDTYRLRGQMTSSQYTAGVTGTYNGKPVAPQVTVEWDLTLHRIYGWYGQHDLEAGQQQQGVIAWNTYAHDAEVQGHVKVGSDVYAIKQSVQFRAYGDSNWGERYPAGTPAVSYPWTWYSVVLPDADPTKDLSIVAGTGRLDTKSVLGIIEGKYADIRLPDGTHVGVRQNEHSKPTPDADGLPLIVTTNDDVVKKFKVTRGQWVNYVDALGSNPIPLLQKVEIETEHYAVLMDFQPGLADYFRLLALHEDYVFSDFEGLGSKVHVVVKKLSQEPAYPWWDINKLFPYPKVVSKVLHDFWSDDGGIEYGYRTDNIQP